MIDFKEKANLIWAVADLLRGDYKQADYGKVILPMTVLRRLDCVLDPTKQKVLNFLPRVEKMSQAAIDATLNKIAGFNFHNRSQFNFKKLVADPNNIAANLRNFINGFSASAREIIEYFNFDDQISRMDDPQTNLLYLVVKRFEEIDLSNMTSIETGYVFEELIRRFAELSNETAGEHFTPREVIRLMVNLLFLNDREILTKKGIVKTLYDLACGTGGMLSIAEEYLQELNPDARLEVFGQEINPESYAICKSDMLIKGQNPTNIKFGNTFTVDGLEYEKFDYMLSNPPFGVEWRKAEKIIKTEYEKKGFAGRFGAGLPRINDGSFLFLQHMISKMKPSDGGSRIGIIFNGSPLFTGGAGSGESEIRKWIIENDMLEAIVALPDQLFYNTGIATYILIVTNRKTPERKGKIQLINATGQKDEDEGRPNRFWLKMARSLGNKRKEIGDGKNGKPDQIGFITKIYGDFRKGPFCKIFPNDYFAYWRVTVEQPLKDTNGKIETDKSGNPKPDSNLRDYENIPFHREQNGKLVKQTIEEYFEREVKPHVPRAWIDESKTKVGYEINFTKYFYEFKPLRSLEEIRRDILALEQETEGMICKAMNHAVDSLKTRPCCLNLMKELHFILLDSVRGRDKARGEFRRTQNYIGRPGDPIERASFIPPAWEDVNPSMDLWEKYLHTNEKDRLVQLAVAKAQFELIHPFLDGNGRLGRMLVPLFLFEKGILSSPMFYMSEYLEKNREIYYARLQSLSVENDWNGWIAFFLNGLIEQATANTEKTHRILDLYERMKQKIPKIVHSRYVIQAIDALFDRPIFQSSDFIARSKVPRDSALRILKDLKKNGLIRDIRTAKGRQAAVVIFYELIDIVEENV